jgi:DUF971 family protein
MQPTAFRLRSADRTLEVDWSDGHQSVFSLRYLRGWCPCAGCQGHFTGFMRFIEVADPMIDDIQPVGGYAVRPVWSDGHQSGILSYSYLRDIELCPPDTGPTNTDCLQNHPLRPSGASNPD